MFGFCFFSSVFFFSVLFSSRHHDSETSPRFVYSLLFLFVQNNYFILLNADSLCWFLLRVGSTFSRRARVRLAFVGRCCSDLIFCRKQPGISIGRLCEKCDGKCVICDSYVRPCTLVRLCDECNYGSYQGRCVICGGHGISDAYYCKECTILEKDVRRQPIFFLCVCVSVCDRR